MERKEAYEQIKKLGLQEECKKLFGKNFTQCKTNELEAVIKAAKELKIDCSRILTACHKSYRGFVWDFKEKDSIKDNNNINN